MNANFKRRSCGAAAIALTTVLGCGSGDIVYYPREGNGGAGGSGGSGGGSSTGAGAVCEGQCVPLGSVDWVGPALLWIGKEDEAPECPPNAPVEGSPVFDNLNAPTVCGACKCDAPSGSCALPTSLTAYNSMSCPAPLGSVPTLFDAPAGWNGACTPANPIPAKKMCPGGDCVQSLTIEPVILTELPCGVSTEPVAAKLSYSWGTFARSCRGVAYGPCASPSEVCAPAVEPGFAQCLVQKGDNACPDTYPDKHLLYKGFVDTRACTPCECSAPIGGNCTASVSVFKDPLCGTPILGGSYGIDSTGPACIDILPSGQAFGSKLATAPVYSPGVCQISGGMAIGEAVPEEPSTFCCLPPGT
jgi:hypothetical protein